MDRSNRKRKNPFTVHSTGEVRNSKGNKEQRYTQWSLSERTGDWSLSTAHRTKVPETKPPQVDAQQEGGSGVTDEDDGMGQGMEDVVDDNGSEEDVDESDEEEEEDTEDPEVKRNPKGDAVLQDWSSNWVDVFMAEIMSLEGRGCSAKETCSCGLDAATFRCIDCTDGGKLLCQGCIVAHHQSLICHRVQEWTGTHFKKTTLKNLGAKLQLGHPAGERCLMPKAAKTDNFVIIHHTGIFPVHLMFCGCGQSSTLEAVQLLRHRLFPATTTRPKTAVTFSTLRLFEIMSYVSKASVFEFYQTISRLTDNTGMNTPKSRYKAFTRVFREWRQLLLFKRAGAGFKEDGVWSTCDGECAVLCPACPQPGKNLPDGWERQALLVPFLFALFIALDANFRLRRKNVSSEAVDPGLCRGRAYGVENTKYMTHLENHTAEKEPKSSCSRHDAVNLANGRANVGCASTGRASVICSRHEMYLPSGSGDLQRGERYCNIDYIFLCAIACQQAIKAFVISYDIACQWSIHLLSRLAAIDPKLFFLDPGIERKFLVPKFHLPAHVEKCRSAFSFNFTHGVGRTDGEAPERGWSMFNALAPSTREMGPGSRRDVLDYHVGDSNWQKTIGLGKGLYLSMSSVNSVSLGRALRRKMISAATEMAQHVISHAKYTSTLPPGFVKRWEEAVSQWEKDPSLPNPFVATLKGPSQIAIRKQIAEAEADDLTRGKDFSLHEKVSPLVFIANGMDLEREQIFVKHFETKLWAFALDRQRMEYQLRSNELRRKIETWRQYQDLYCPEVERQRPRPTITEPKSHEEPLFLPSAIVHNTPVREILCQHEWRLRYAQAHESLETLRGHLQVRSYYYKFKDAFLRGQVANTRARNSIESMNDRIDLACEDYRKAYKALCALKHFVPASALKWEEELFPLKDEDVRDLSSGRAGESEGRKTMSWIWTTAFGGSGATPEGGDGSTVPAGGVEPETSEGRDVPANGDATPEGGDGSTVPAGGVEPGTSEGRDESLVASSGNAPNRLTATSFTNERLRIEWCKSRARAKRFTEEVALLTAEMQRVVSFMSWKASDWKEKGANLSSSIAQQPLNQIQSEGLRAYAYRQAELFESLGKQFRSDWATIPAFVQRMQDIIIDPSIAKRGELDTKVTRTKPVKPGRM